MDLQKIQKAEQAVLRVDHDYRPIVELKETLRDLREHLSSMGDLEKAKAKLEAEVAALKAEAKVSKEEVDQLEDKRAKAQANYDAVKKAIADLKAGE